MKKERGEDLDHYLVRQDSSLMFNKHWKKVRNGHRFHHQWYNGSYVTFLTFYSLQLQLAWDVRYLIRIKLQRSFENRIESNRNEEIYFITSNSLRQKLEQRGGGMTMMMMMIFIILKEKCTVEQPFDNLHILRFCRLSSSCTLSLYFQSNLLFTTINCRHSFHFESIYRERKC